MGFILTSVLGLRVLKNREHDIYPGKMHKKVGFFKNLQKGISE